MTLSFYFAPMSTSTVTEAVLAELQIPCERVEISIQKGDTRKQDFLTLNPNGRVPVIVHDGVPIWESAAITMYLGETFGVERHLYPTSGLRRGEAMKWIVWGNVTLAEAGGRLAASLPPGKDGGAVEGSRDWVPVDQRSPAARKRALDDLSNCLKVLEEALQGHPFILSDYTLADTHLWTFVGWIASMGFDLSAYKNVADWVRRCGKRPALAKMMGE